LDDAHKIAAIVRSHVEAGLPAVHRSQQVDLYRERIRALDTSRQIDPLTLRETWGGKTTASKTRKGVTR
jgi:malonate decarboxylase beta subunit